MIRIGGLDTIWGFGGLVSSLLFAALLGAGAGKSYADRSVVPPGEGDNDQVTYELTTPAANLVLNQMLSLTLVLRDKDGGPIDGATVWINGGMPAHGHGLPTAPAVTSMQAGGIYVIEGLRFNMPGLWELQFRVDADGIIDMFTVEIQL